MSSPPNVPTAVEHAIRVLGCDIGTINFAICMLEFKGYTYNEDKSDFQPDYNILLWELWNLKERKIISIKNNGTYEINSFTSSDDEYASSYHSGDDTDEDEEEEEDVKLYDILKSKMKGTDFQQWRDTLVEMTSKNKKIFEEYTCLTGKSDRSVIAVENQMDHVSQLRKNSDKGGPHKVQMYTLSNVFLSCIRATDISKYNYSKRIVCNRAAKYGIAQTGELSYYQRKKASENTTFDLLRLTSIHRLYITALKKLWKFEKQKLDDLTDAFLLALKVSAELYENYQKYKKKPKKRQPPKSNKKRKRDVVVDDDNKEEGLLRALRRKKRKIQTNRSPPNKPTTTSIDLTDKK